MIVLHGIYRFGRKRVACRNCYCTCCDSVELTDGYRSLLVAHIFFIPLLPVGTDTKWHCTKCNNDIDSRRPSRPFVLIAGILCGFLFMFIGTMIRIETGENGAYWLILFGFLLSTGLYYLIRKQNYGIYLQSSKAVTPLNGESCPHCHAPILSSAKPRCHACKVNIIMK
jgi:LPXTG-motif cell wall-anchored protein